MKIYRALLYIGIGYVPTLIGMDATTPSADTPAAVSAQWDRSSGFDEGLTSTAAEDDARGNWYIKRKFLIDARNLYEQIKQRVPEVAAREKNFVDMRDTITHEVAQFSIDVGIEPHALDSAITATMQQLEKERAQKEQLTEEERSTYENLDMLRKELEQIQQDVQALGDNQNALLQAMPVLVEQIRICTEYEQQAWDKYERISEVLNDHLAEQLYRDIQSYLNHINAIDAYIQGQLTDYFNQTMGLIRDQMNTIKNAIQKLKEQGIEFESQATKELREKQVAHVAQPKQQQKPQGFVGNIMHALKTIGQYIAYPFVYLASKIAQLWR